MIFFTVTVGICLSAMFLMGIWFFISMNRRINERERERNRRVNSKYGDN